MKDTGGADDSGDVADVPTLASCVLTQAFDQGNDATVDMTSVSTYDSEARVIDTEQTLTQGGSTSATYAYDANDCVTSSTSASEGPQGSIAVDILSTCDTKGWSTHEDAHRVSQSEDGEQVVDMATAFTNTYDTADQLTFRERDNDADLTIDTTITLTWNADGLKTGEETDLEADGTADTFRVWTYDADGYAATSEDWTGEEPHRRQTFTRDADGRAVRIEDDEGADGTPERVTTSVFDGATFFDAHISIDEANDGTIDSTAVVTAVCP